MNLTILIIGNILICLLVFFLTKDFMHPGFLFCIPWITFLTLLVFSNYEYDGSSLCYIYLLFGTIVFQLGCFLGIKKIKRKERLINTDNQFVHIFNFYAFPLSYQYLSDFPYKPIPITICGNNWLLPEYVFCIRHLYGSWISSNSSGRT